MIAREVSLSRSSCDGRDLTRHSDPAVTMNDRAMLECREAAVLTEEEGAVTAQRLVSSSQLILSHPYARALTGQS